jgi:hypothetical protein
VPSFILEKERCESFERCIEFIREAHGKAEHRDLGEGIQKTR